MAEHWLAALNMSFVFVLKLLCFYIGYKIVKHGAELLREGVRGDFKLNANFSGLKADLASASPGLLFVLLGVLLVLGAMLVPKATEITRTVQPLKTNEEAKALPIPVLGPSASQPEGTRQ